MLTENSFGGKRRRKLVWIRQKTYGGLGKTTGGKGGSDCLWVLREGQCNWGLCLEGGLLQARP